MIADFFAHLKQNKTFLNNKRTQIIIVSDDNEAKTLSEVGLFLGLPTFTLTDFRCEFGDDINSFHNEFMELLSDLKAYYECPKASKILIAPIRTIALKMANEIYFKTKKLEFASSLNIDELKNTLLNWGYYFVDIVQSDGEVSFRGDIIDISSPNSNTSYRISLFGDEIESIREFDDTSQKSKKKELQSIEISPAFLSLDSQEYEQIMQDIKNDTSDVFVKDINSIGFWYLKKTHFLIENKNTIITPTAFSEIDEVYINKNQKLPQNQMEQIPKLALQKEYKQIVLKNNASELLSINKEKKITIISTNESKIRHNEINLNNKKYNFVYKSFAFSLNSVNELIISLNQKSKTRSSRVKKSKMRLDELIVGEYVVHDSYGVGIFNGIKQIKILGTTKDCIEVLYQNTDKLLLPVLNINLLERYVVDGGVKPTLDCLGKQSFIRAKHKAKDKIFAIANELMRLAAKRELSRGIAIKTDFEQLKLLQYDLGFTYTTDQQKSIDDIFNDFNSGYIMDRLISGDVGFGKTEVALNAILAVALSGYQSLFLVPTSLLCNQHFASLQDRLTSYGVKIAKLNSHNTKKQTDEIKQNYINGDIDIIIGTHSLLNMPYCEKLALIIIDEEHKFGVKQKEKIKQIKQNVHMLFMSATPIPRTLNLALSKVKQISSILTPPMQREGVSTFLKEQSDTIIKEAILREKRRGGQVFYISNKIATIEQNKKYLYQLLGESNIKIEIIHSKIASKKAEQLIEDFANKKFDILLATSIIESGIHLPNANTIIIKNANNFGIADLHQLRGRVGRSKIKGYCYFIVKDKDELNDNAIKRLVALERNSHLGSGEALAMRDLEIRGGGNLIGEDQSGHIKQIGYGLYLRMLEDAIVSLSNAKNNTKQNENVTNINEHNNCELNLTITAYLNPSYIFEDRLRLDLYRRLAKCIDKEDVFEIVEEMEDRFGRADEISKKFCDLMIIKIKAIDKNIKSISNCNDNIKILYQNDTSFIIKATSKDDDCLMVALNNFLITKNN
jgi:transcription-repair coupling factor (superfamily II helicase)